MPLSLAEQRERERKTAVANYEGKGKLLQHYAAMVREEVREELNATMEKLVLALFSHNRGGIACRWR